MEFKEIDAPPRGNWDELEGRLLTIPAGKAILVTPAAGQTLEQLRSNIVASFANRATKVSTKVMEDGIAVWVKVQPEKVIADRMRANTGATTAVSNASIPSAAAPQQPKLLTAPRGTYAKPPQKAK